MSQTDYFAKLSRTVITDKRLTPTDIVVYAYVLTLPPDWQIRQGHLATELGMSLSTIIRSINRLDAAGYLSYKLRETDKKTERREVKAARPKLNPTRPKTDGYVKNELPGMSNLTHYVEIKERDIATTTNKVESDSEKEARARYAEYLRRFRETVLSGQDRTH